MSVESVRTAPGMRTAELPRLGAMTRQPAARAVTFGVLGPLTADDDRGAVPLKGPRHRAVLARLLIARGRVVPVDRLADDLWEEPGAGAVAAIRTFVSDLRRVLEPDRPPRQPARLLVTAPPGYALRAGPDAVDAWRFEAAVVASDRLLATGQAPRALAVLDEALALWRGPAYAESAAQGWARAEIDRLDELRMLAVERRSRALLDLDRAAEAASDLQAQATDHPLREDAWQLLATALYRAGRQGDALAALRRARRRLAEELGVDPGPGLRQLEADILAQAPHLSPPAAAHAPDPAAWSGPTPASRLVAAGGAARSPTGADAGDRPFVGRAAELGRLTRLAQEVADRGRPALALVSGDAGAGKTALAEALTRRLTAGGWTAAWGRSPEYEGAPVAWPWAQITEALAGPAVRAVAPDPAPVGPAGPDTTAAAVDDARRGTDEDPAAARFRTHRAAAARLTAAARATPLLLVLDDLHLADTDTLDLLTALLAEPDPVTGPVLIVAMHRATEITPVLTAALARLARAEPARVYLGGLAETATGELVRALAGRDLDAAAVSSIHRRSGGNPFFVRELARLFAAEGSAALRQVPAGVRDVIRHRLARLADPTRAVLRLAAVLGREVDPDLLSTPDGDASVLDALDEALRAGLLTEHGADRRLRFTHILVRDTIYDDLSAPRRAALHTAAGVAIERRHPHDVAALAHHFAHTTGQAGAEPAARYARAAAEQAERRGNPHEAARLWRLALAAHDRAGGDAGRRLDAVMGLGRALAVAGHLDEARGLRAEALSTAVGFADPVRTAVLLTAFEVPAVWTRNDDEDLSGRIAEAAERTLAALPATAELLRSRLLSTLAMELRGTTTDRGLRAASEAEAIARRLGHPAALAFALNARFMHTFHRTGLAAERARIGAELIELADRHDLVTFAVLGHLISLQAHSALADLVTADAHAAAADHLADRHGLPLVGVFTGWYAGLRLAVGGRRAEAESAYRAAQLRLAGSAMPGVEDGLLALALLSLRLRAGEPALAPAAGEDPDWGPYAPWTRPLALLDAGRRDEARDALRSQPASPHDLLREARLCLTARAALALGDRDRMRYAHDELLPAAAELAGAGSGVLTLGPVAVHLVELADALRRHEPPAGG